MGHSRPLAECMVMIENGIRFGVRSAFRLGVSVVPALPKCAGKIPDSAPGIGPRHFQNEFNVGECPFGTPRMTCLQDWPHMQLFNGLRKQMIGRVPPGLACQILQHGEGLPKHIAADPLRIGPQVEAVRALRLGL